MAECPICKCPDVTHLFKAFPLDYTATEKIDIFRCPECGYGYTGQAHGEEIDAMYSSGSYSDNEGPVQLLVKPLLNVLERNKLRYVNRWKQSGSLLEIGSGKGRFLQQARRAGFEVFGIEPSARSYKISTKLYGSIASSKTLDEFIDVNRKKFDVIFLWHVFEHLPDPHITLEKISRILADDGIVLMAVPNFDSMQAKLGGPNWYHLDPPRHLHHFSPDSLSILFDRSGYRTLEVAYDSFYQDFLGEITTWLNLSSPVKNCLLNLVKRNPVFVEKLGINRVIFGVAINVLLLPIFILPAFFATLGARILRKSGTMIYVITRGV